MQTELGTGTNSGRLRPFAFMVYKFLWSTWFPDKPWGWCFPRLDAMWKQIYASIVEQQHLGRFDRVDQFHPRNFRFDSLYPHQVIIHHYHDALE